MKRVPGYNKKPMTQISDRGKYNNLIIRFNIPYIFLYRIFLFIFLFTHCIIMLPSRLCWHLLPLNAQTVFPNISCKPHHVTENRRLISSMSLLGRAGFLIRHNSFTSQLTYHPSFLVLNSCLNLQNCLHA